MTWRGAGTFVCTLLVPAFGVAGPLDAGRLPGYAGVDARFEQVALDLREAYDAQLADYAAEIAQRPHDVVLQVDRCRFMENFSFQYEYIPWAGELYDLATDCMDEVSGRFPEHPEVELYRLEQLYGEEQLDAGAALLSGIERRGWTRGQIARLNAMLAGTADSLGSADAGEYALRALALDRSADVRLIAATHLVGRGERARAIEILANPFDTRTQGWYVVRKMQLLAEAGAGPEVTKLYSLLQPDGTDYNHFDAATALARSGAVDAARWEFARSNADWTTADERARFRFEMEQGTSREALAAYTALRDQGWAEDPLAINRVALFVRDPSLGWKARDLVGMLGLAATLAAVALLMWIPLSLVHYRALARRARTGEAAPTDGWGLTHAWAALFAFGVASCLALYAAGPLSFVFEDASPYAIDASDAHIARSTLVDMFLSILLLLPLFWIARLRDPTPWSARWRPWNSVLAGIAAALLFRVPLFLFMRAFPDGISSLVSDNLVWQTLGLVSDHYGRSAAFWMVALAAPAVEEFVFRGVLLRALANHVAFGWANAIQAGLFAAAHFEPAAMPLLFVFGLVAGWLTRRSGGLLAPMTLHAVFNGVAAFVLL